MSRNDHQGGNRWKEKDTPGAGAEGVKVLDSKWHSPAFVHLNRAAALAHLISQSVLFI